MTCDLCGKEQATVHLTEIIDNKVTELHLCEGCAREKGAQMEQHFGLTDLLSGLADFGKAPETIEGGVVGKGLACSNCGMSYADFRKLGRLGCSQCYETFREQIGPLLKRIHGTPYHAGKQPGSPAEAPAGSPAGSPGRATAAKPAIRPRSELRQLKERLQKAIQSEEFEEAARIRDKIRELERKKS